MADSSEKPIDALAEERTVKARERTLLAVERTFSSWIRTGLAAVATGFAVVRLTPQSDSTWLIEVLGVLLILAGGIIFALGYWSYRDAMKQMEASSIRGVSPLVVATLTFVFLTGSVIALVLVFVR
jgi:putative membrane protein